MLYEEGYSYRFMLRPMVEMFERTISLENYFLLDESMMQTILIQWSYEQDQILSDLCGRFMHRKLFKYVAVDDVSPSLLEAITAGMQRMGFDSSYYLQIDYPSTLPYDVYRPGREDDSLPILLLDEKEQLTEISQKIRHCPLDKRHPQRKASFVFSRGNQPFDAISMILSQKNNRRRSSHVNRHPYAFKRGRLRRRP